MQEPVRMGSATVTVPAGEWGEALNKGALDAFDAALERLAHQIGRVEDRAAGVLRDPEPELVADEVAGLTQLRRRIRSVNEAADRIGSIADRVDL